MMKRFTQKVVQLILMLLVMGNLSAYAEGFAQFKVRDMALIYQGGNKRIDWTMQQFAPYVSHTFANGKTEWTFDSFLFLDYEDGLESTFIPQVGKKKATKVEWEWYLNRIFENGKSLSALDACVDSLSKKIGKPGFRHKIVLSLPTPLAGADWGMLDGKNLDFNNLEDQAKAANWFVNQLVSRFKAARYRHLDLMGIYWIDEDMCHTKDVCKLIAPYVHKKKLSFVWIPYFKARGSERWKELGFDMVYYQPNCFFNKAIPESRIDEACDIASNLDMAMEFECDRTAIFGPENNSYDRMQAYIDAFKRKGVWEKSSVAYYTGSHYLIDVQDYHDAENQKIVDELMQIIVDRRHKGLKK